MFVLVLFLCFEAFVVYLLCTLECCFVLFFVYNILLLYSIIKKKNFSQESMFNTDNERNEKLYQRMMLTLPAEPLTAILFSSNPLRLLNPLFSLLSSPTHVRE